MAGEQQVLIDRLRAEVAAALAGIQPPPPLARPVQPPAPGTPINRYIDHTLLKPEATAGEIETLCAQAREYQFAAVCINGVYVPLAAALLRETDVTVCTVTGFPLGASQPEAKAYEAQLAIHQGAREVDMVLHVGALKNGDLKALQRDIAAVVTVCHAKDAVCKVILETSKLTREEIIRACVVAQLAQADFVKTSTGFGGGGATVEDVALMRQTVGDALGVKASGGVRTYADAQVIIEAGATRIGTSSGMAIVAGRAAEEGDY
jgi:deoxyribose-phosphate aldolase